MGDPTEAALLVSARKAGIEAGPPRIDATPFESARQYMVTLHPPPKNGSRPRAYVKGSVERVLDICDSMATDSGAEVGLDREAVITEAERLAAQRSAGPGLRLCVDARRYVRTGRPDP